MQVQPTTRSLLRIDLSIAPDFRWGAKICGTAEALLIVVEDAGAGAILFHETFVLRQRCAEDGHNASPTVPMIEPVPLNYYISAISDRCPRAETRLLISFKPLARSSPAPRSAHYLCFLRAKGWSGGV